MEPIFEISFRDTEEMYAQLFRRLYGKRYLIYGISFAVFTLWMVYLWIVNQWILYGGMALVFAVGTFWYLTYPTQMGKQNYRHRLNHLAGKEPHIRMTFDRDIHVSDEGPGSTLSYDRVAKVYLLKDMFIFVMSYQSAFFAPYDGLTKGTREELIAFLEQQCPQAKFYR